MQVIIIIGENRSRSKKIKERNDKFTKRGRERGYDDECGGQI